MSRGRARGHGQGLLAQRASVHKGTKPTPRFLFFPGVLCASARDQAQRCVSTALARLLGTFGDFGGSTFVNNTKAKEAQKTLRCLSFRFGGQKKRPLDLFSLGGMNRAFFFGQLFFSQSEVPETPRLAWMAEASESALVAEIPPLQNMWSSPRSTQPVLYAVARSSLLSMSPPLSPSLPCT